MIETETRLSRKEICGFLRGNADKELFARASALNKNKICLRGLIEFSNYCTKSCLYCGLRCGNKKIVRYRMTPKEILSAARSVARAGIDTVVMQSGDDPAYRVSDICGIIRQIKREFPPMAVTLSVGERNLDDYRAFREAGADRYLLKFETTNKNLYKKIHPYQSLSKRFEILECLKELKYQTGTGPIIGLPGQTIEDLCSDILFLEKYKPYMAGIGPLVPHIDTPYSDMNPGSIIVSLRFIALTRIILKDCYIPSTTALSALNVTNTLTSSIKSGCNVIMVNFTPHLYAKHYQLFKKIMGHNTYFKN